MNFDLNLDSEPRKKQGQYFTPPWLAEAIVHRHFGWLSTTDVVCEPSCGQGAFLNALGADIPAFGVEVDEKLAERCRQLTGREVVVGRFENARLPANPTAIIGNPPFKVKVIEDFLTRSHAVLPEEGTVGMILPAYFLQTAARVSRYAEKWSIATEVIPRNAFPGLSKPIVFSLFRKDRQRTLVGMAFFFEAHAVAHLPAEIRAIFTQQGAPMWPRVVEKALIALGGRGTLQEIYKIVEGDKPTATKHWREQVRKVLQTRFVSLGNGRWGHPNAA